jgi:hypothetical protein
MLSAMVRWGKRPICWIAYPIPRRSLVPLISVLGSPLMRISPSDGSIRRFTMRMLVVLPHPEGPTRTQISPSSTSKERSLTTGREEPG